MQYIELDNMNLICCETNHRCFIPEVSNIYKPTYFLIKLVDNDIIVLDFIEMYFYFDELIEVSNDLPFIDMDDDLVRKMFDR